jgi:outer membrane cobalamin receptor
VFPRGGESDYTLVLVDGVRANAFGGGFDFSLLPFGDVSQVESCAGRRARCSAATPSAASCR